MSRARWLILVALIVVAVIVLWPLRAGASDLTVPVLEIIRGEPGSTVVVSETPVPPPIVGRSCRVRLVGANNASVHDGNRLTVGSGTGVVFDDFETTPNSGSLSAGRVTLADTVTVELTFGPDGVTSGGYVIDFDCPPDTTTTTTVPGTTTTTTPGTTTTSLPPSPVPPPVVTVPDFTG